MIYLQRRPLEDNFNMCCGCYVNKFAGDKHDKLYNKFCNIVCYDKILKQVIPKRLIKNEMTVKEIRESDLYKTLKSRSEVNNGA